MDNRQSSNGNLIGCGLLGCAGGLLVGLFGGSLLLLLLSFGWAIFSTVPSVTSTTNLSSDLRLVLTETFLNRIVQEAMDETVRVDILPDQRLQLTFETDLSEFGISTPVQVTGPYWSKLNLNFQNSLAF